MLRNVNHSGPDNYQTLKGAVFNTHLKLSPYGKR